MRGVQRSYIITVASHLFNHVTHQKRKVTVDDADDSERSNVTHNYTILASKVDKYLVTYALLRLKVLTGKILIFTNNVESAFRLKLFLDKFSIRYVHIPTVSQFGGGRRGR